MVHFTAYRTFLYVVNMFNNENTLVVVLDLFKSSQVELTRPSTQYLKHIIDGKLENGSVEIL